MKSCCYSTSKAYKSDQRFDVFFLFDTGDLRAPLKKRFCSYNKHRNVF